MKLFLRDLARDGTLYVVLSLVLAAVLLAEAVMDHRRHKRPWDERDCH